LFFWLLHHIATPKRKADKETIRIIFNGFLASGIDENVASILFNFKCVEHDFVDVNFALNGMLGSPSG
jgi:hypothetical protein